MKITFRSVLTVGSLFLLGVAGCAEPGVVQVHPTNMPVKGEGKDAGAPKKDSGKGQITAPSTGNDGDDTTDDGAPEDDSSDDTTVKPVDAGKKDAGTSTTPPKGDAGGGSKTDAGKPSVTEPGPDEGGMCPSGYMCNDSKKQLSDMGLEGTITDPDGKDVAFSCAKGGQETCDPKDPKKSCPNFPNAFCMHVKLTGLISADIYQCGQKCTQ